MKVLFILFFLIISGITFSQAIIRGTITDEKTNEPIPLSKVKVDGMNAGANADFDGEFRLSIAAGTYKLIFSNSIDGYLDTNTTVTVNDGDDIVLDIKLTKDRSIVVLGPVNAGGRKTVGATSVEAADQARMEEQVSTEAVTADEMKDKGINDVAAALQTSPGLSVEDGKSVYVRGLGDRYTKTILNGMEIPGLDPDRNAVQLDIFPSTVVDNLTVYKSFLPRFAGDFTGGLVDITTKDFPGERSIYAKLSLGYNSSATFNNQSLNYEGGSLDWIGFDDGTRALPINSAKKIPNVVLSDPSLETMTRQFGQTMATERASNFMDQNYTYSYGNRLTTKKNLTYGYNIVGNYRNQHRYYQDVQFNDFRKDLTNQTTETLEAWRNSTGETAEHNVMWTALIMQAVKFKRSSISLALLHTQNGISTASQLRDVNSIQNPSILVKQSIQYNQRSVSNANLTGKHFLGSDTLNRWKLEWKLSPTYSIVRDPDIRSTALEELEEKGPNGETLYDYSPAVGSEIRRIWRYLNEYNIGGRVDLTYNFKVRDRKSELAFGVLNTYKHREFEVLDYLFGVQNPDSYSGDPDYYFQSENIWTPETDQGTYVVGNKEPANTYIASQNVSGVYIMNELPLTKKFDVIYGARVEKVMNWYTGQNNAGTIVYNNELVLDALNVLPSVNMVYRMQKDADSSHYKHNTNLRASYAMTLARPSFKEKSIAQIYDPIQGRTFNGNIDLIQTNIHNVDFRWEHFFGRVELVSASAFYKRFINPIEMVSFNTAPNNIIPLNTGTADLYGAEIEARKAIGFDKPSMSHISFVVGANFSYILSRINMNEVKIVNGNTIRTEKEIREENARDGETIGDYRPMYGQSPWIVNAFATFKNDSIGFAINVSYNVQGKKLAVIGIGSIPDVYEQPFHGLSFKISQNFGADKQWQASITGNNMLMSARRKFYEAYDYDTQIYSYYNEGMTVSAAVSITLGAKKKK